MFNLNLFAKPDAPRPLTRPVSMQKDTRLIRRALSALADGQDVNILTLHEIARLQDRDDDVADFLAATLRRCLMHIDDGETLEAKAIARLAMRNPRVMLVDAPLPAPRHSWGWANLLHAA